jgi:hypothetical protein
VKAFKIIVIATICYFLVACADSPSKKTVEAPEKSIIVDPEREASQESVLASIQTEYLRTQDVSARNFALISLANDYHNKQNCVATNIILKQIQAKLEIASHRALANLLKAECALASLRNLSDLSNKQPLLDLIEKWLDSAAQEGIYESSAPLENDFTISTRMQIAKAILLAENKRFGQALSLLFQNQTGDRLAEQVNMGFDFYSTVWDWFSVAKKEERAQLAGQYSLLNEYKIILDTIEDASVNDDARQAIIRQWLSNNKNSRLIDNLPIQVEKYLAIASRENQSIAILLPLSGRLSGQGEAIKQGMLSAYYQKLDIAKQNNTTVQASIEFIDTGSLAILNSAITPDLLDSYDTIVGPLLRSHIEQINAFNLLGKQQLLLNQVAAGVNTFDNLVATFSLSPEQEAEQLVALMRARNITRPIVIFDGSSTTTRMKDAFINAWTASDLSNNDKLASLQQIRYSDNKSMRVSITSSLDVLQSQNRISQLSNLDQERVYSVTRNRRDVDAFVVFARPNDVELINPIIESSISLFTDEQIPVFATSYSYDHKQSKNSQRDLRNLVFVDMPWLLPEGRDQDLSVKVDSLFNQPPSTFLRLFAFGYDALVLIDNLAQLSTFEHLFIKGLSGNLSVNDKQQLSRELSWLAINNAQSTQ